MANLAAALKAEIARIARKEIRADIGALKKASTSHRHDIAGLKKRIQAMERQAKHQGRMSSVPATVKASADEPEQQLRFSAQRLAAQRARLGLSVAKFALLIGVSAMSVHKWEGGKARPRRTQLEAIAAIRTLGKRETAARMEELASSQSRVKRRA